MREGQAPKAAQDSFMYRLQNGVKVGKQCSRLNRVFEWLFANRNFTVRTVAMKMARLEFFFERFSREK